MARSRNLPLGIGFGLLTLILLALGWWLAKGDPEGRSESPSTVVAGDRTARDAIRASDRPEASAIVAAATESGSEPERELFPASAPDELLPVETVLHGRLIFPPRSPEDETLEVLCLTQLANTRVVFDWTFPDEDGERQVFHRAKVAADGSFQLNLPDAKEIWIDVDGRFLYVPEPLQLSPARAPESLILHPELGGWIRGRVSLPDDGTLEGESVQLRLGMRDVSWNGMAHLLVPREATFQASGEFEFRGVPPGDEHRVFASPAHYAPTLVQDVAAAPGLISDLELTFALGAELRGTVRDLDGEPIEGVTITVNTDADSEDMFDVALLQQARKKAKTTADGRFVFAGAPVGKIEIQAQKSEWGLEETRGETLAPGETRTIDFEFGVAGSLGGVVRWPDGSGAGNVRVSARYDLDADGEEAQQNFQEVVRLRDRSTETDENGVFRFRGLGESPIALSAVSREPHPEFGQGSAKEAGLKGDGEDVELVLEPSPKIAGLVRNSDGEPLRTFTVHVESRHDADDWLARIAQTKSSERFETEDGRFEMGGLAEGKWNVNVSAEGYCRLASPLEVTLPRGESEPDLDITVQRGASLTGKVLDAQGTPVAGATLLSSTARSGMMAARGNDEPTIGGKTDATGTFEITGIQPGSWTLRASCTGQGSSEEQAFDLVAGQEVSGLTFRLTQGGTIQGEVYGNDGKPLVQAMVNLMSAGFQDGRMTRSDDHGAFTFEHVDAGSWQVMAMPSPTSSNDEGDVTATFNNMEMAKVEVIEGEVTFIALGMAPEDPVLLTGRVESGGEPLEGALLSFIADGENTLGEMRMATSQVDGTYEVELEKPGAYVIQVRSEGEWQGSSADYLERVPAQETHRIDFELPTGRIEGRIFSAQGTPMEGTGVSLRREGPMLAGSGILSQNSSVSTDESGRYAFGNVAPGTYAVHVGREGWAAMIKNGTAMRGGLEIEAGTRLENVDLELETPGSIKGQVVDGIGQPVAGAAIFVHHESGQAVHRTTPHASSSDGKFAYQGLGPGLYSVTVRHGEDRAGAAQAVRVLSETETEVTLVVEPGTLLAVSALDEDRNPLPCRVSVTDSEGREVNGLTTTEAAMSSFLEGFSTTEHRVGPLPPGTYSVHTVTWDGQEKTRKVKLSGKPTRSVKERFRD